MDRTTLHMFRRQRAAGKPLTGADTAYEHLKDLADVDRETFVVLILNARKQLLAKELVSIGTVTGSLVHQRELFRPALLAGGTDIVLAHNHPSGDPSPSYEDSIVTERAVAAGAILGIQVLDHIIIGENRFFAFSREQPESLKPPSWSEGVALLAADKSLPWS